MHQSLLIVAAITLLCSSVLRGQDGALDPTFGEGGKVVTVVGTFDDQAHAIALQQNQRIIVVGHTYRDGRYAFVVARYLPNGVLDSQFGENGVTVVNIGDGDARARAVAIQPDGDIVVAGLCVVEGRELFTVARFLEKTGRLDPTFNDVGYAITPIGAGWSAAHAVTIQPNGAIVAAGYAQITPDYVFAVVRYDRNGKLDPTFGEGGIVKHQFSFGNDVANAVYAHSDDAITVVGTSQRTGGNSDVALVRLKGSGAPDGAFGTEGTVKTPIEGTFNEYGNALAVASNGDLFVAGSTNNRFQDFVTLRYNYAGQLVPEFGVNGLATSNVEESLEIAEATTIFLQPDGKVVVSGSRTRENEIDFGLVRYLSSGEVDNTFGESGFVTTSFGNGTHGIRTSVMQRDGKILVAGGSHDGTQGRIALARYNNPSVSAASSVTELTVDEPRVWPNPARTTINVNSEMNVVSGYVSVVDVIGRTHLCPAEIVGTSTTIHVSHLNPGVYVASATRGGARPILFRLISDLGTY